MVDVMRTLVFFLLMILSTSAACPAFAQQSSAHFYPLQYIGKQHAPETVEPVRTIITGLLPKAIDQAETLLEMTLDTERLDVYLQDLPADKSNGTNWTAIQGADHPILVVYVEPVLRGDFHDSDANLQALTHEMIRALMRQNIDYAEYCRLPEWFQEGVPHFLLDRLPDNRQSQAAIGYENPYAMLGTFAADQFSIPEVTGGFFLTELDGAGGEVGGVQADVAYLDPPYPGTTAYEKEYRILDEIFEGRALATSPFSQVGGTALIDRLETVLNALVDVEKGLSREAHQHRYVQSLKKQVDLSRQSIDQTRDNYTKGAADFTRFLTTLIAHYRLEQSLVQANAQLLQYRIDLYRALGGSWELQRKSTKPNGAD